MSGVTARTPRHYDDIGLLSPAYIGANGYRFYEDEQLRRSQQILVLRSLADIAETADSAPDTLAALKRRHARLFETRHRLARMADTVARTITQLERKNTMAAALDHPENLFEGFDHTLTEEEAQRRWPKKYE